jgi:hypothetical protein
VAACGAGLTPEVGPTVWQEFHEAPGGPARLELLDDVREVGSCVDAAGAAGLHEGVPAGEADGSALRAGEEVVLSVMQSSA